MNNPIERDSNFFSGSSIFGLSSIKESINDYEGYYVINIQTGNASSIDTGKMINGGTAITTDTLKFSGSDSSF